MYKEAKEELEKTFSMPVEILSIKDAEKTEKTIKAKPGKPGIYLE